LFDPEDSQSGAHSEVEIFTFPETGQQIRVIGTADNPLFCHADVCRGLDHSNPSVAIALVEAGDRVQIDARETDIPNLNMDKIINPVMWFLTEAGFYDLAIASRAPGAKAFKRWITHDVLPALRKTGSYGLVPKQFDPTDLDHVAQLAQIAADQKRQIAARDEKIKELTPGHELAETYAAANGTMTVQMFARTVQQWAKQRKINVKQEHVFDFLGQIGMLIRSKARSDYGQATATAIKSGWCENATKDVKTRTRGTVLTTWARITPPGVDHAWKRIHAAIGEFGTLDPKVIRP